MARKKQKVILLIVAILVCVGSLGYYFVEKVIPLKESQRNFDEAKICEIQNEYRKAYDFYSRVIEEDEENYIVAKNKMTALNTIFDANKIASLGYIILEQEEYVTSIDDLSDIKVNVGRRAMSCRINNIGYVVSPQELGDGEFCSSKKSDIENFYITEYKVIWADNGFLTEAYNNIRQITSDTKFKAAELPMKSDLIKSDLILEYLSEYKEMNVLPTDLEE